jgi:hypothetical protein
MRGQSEPRPTARGLHCRGHKTAFAASRAGEHKFAIGDVKAVQFLGVIEAEETVFGLS